MNDDDQLGRLSSPTPCPEQVRSSTSSPSVAEQLPRTQRRRLQAHNRRFDPHRRPSPTVNRSSTSSVSRRFGPRDRTGASSKIRAESSRSKPSDMDNPTAAVDLSIDSTSSKGFGSSTSTTGSSSQNMLLQVFRSDLENIRAKISCTICIKLLFEPYTLGCGHTFCYSCLCQWFQSNKSNKTCPECRTAVKEQPAPAYLVKDMVQIFVGRAEFMGENESPEENVKLQKEESDQVERDRQNKNPRNGGLFRGCFRSIFSHLHPFHDVEDGVDRCPTCNWELENGSCGGCGLRFDRDGNVAREGSFDGEFSDMEDDDSDLGFGSVEDLDEDLAAELDGLEEESVDFAFRDGHAEAGAMNRAMRRLVATQLPGFGPHPRDLSGARPYPLISSEDESEDEEEYGSLSDFIDDDEMDAAGGEPGSESAASRGAHGDPFNNSLTDYPTNGFISDDLTVPGSTDSSDVEFDEGGGVSNGRQPRAAQRSLFRQRSRRQAAMPRGGSATGEPERPDDAVRRNGRVPLFLESDDTEGDADAGEVTDQASVATTINAETNGGRSSPTHAQSRSRLKRTSGRDRRRGIPVATLSSESEDDPTFHANGQLHIGSVDDDGDVDMDDEPIRTGRRQATASRGNAVAARDPNPDRGGLSQASITVLSDSDSDSEAPIRRLPRRKQQAQAQSQYESQPNSVLARHPRNPGSGRRSHAVSGLGQREDASSRLGPNHRTNAVSFHRNDPTSRTSSALQLGAAQHHPGRLSSPHSIAPSAKDPPQLAQGSEGYSEELDERLSDMLDMPLPKLETRVAARPASGVMRATEGLPTSNARVQYEEDRFMEEIDRQIREEEEEILAWNKSRGHVEDSSDELDATTESITHSLGIPGDLLED